MSSVTITFEASVAEPESKFLQKAVEAAMKAYRGRNINFPADASESTLVSMSCEDSGCPY